MLLSRQKQWPADAQQLDAVVAQKFSLDESRSFEYFERQALAGSDATATV